MPGDGSVGVTIAVLNSATGIIGDHSQVPNSRSKPSDVLGGEKYAVQEFPHRLASNKTEISVSMLAITRSNNSYIPHRSLSKDNGEGDVDFSSERRIAPPWILGVQDRKTRLPITSTAQGDQSLRRAASTHISVQQDVVVGGVVRLGNEGSGVVGLSGPDEKALETLYHAHGELASAEIDRGEVVVHTTLLEIMIGRVEIATTSAIDANELLGLVHSQADLNVSTYMKVSLPHF